MKNPNFKETNKILIDENCEETTDILVYKLKNISNSFYFACSTRLKPIQIHKYFYETKSFKIIGKLDVISSHTMKYLYNPLNNQEYFFIINDNEEIEIYLIKNENTFKLIQKLNYINDEDSNIINNHNNNINNNSNSIGSDDDSYGGSGAMFTSCYSLDAIYNESDKSVYIIINYLIMENAGGDESSFDAYNSKSINIFKFNNDKLILIKTFKFDIDFDLNSLIYINNDCDKKYLLDSFQRENLALIELKSNYNNYEIEKLFNDDNNKKKLSNFLIRESYHDTCIIYGKNKFDFLYILKGNKLMIINFTIKNVDKIIDFNKTYFRNIDNWNNNYLIIFEFNSVYVFDINNNNIITEYKKKDCRSFLSHSFPDKNEDLGIFTYYDKIECYFV